MWKPPMLFTVSSQGNADAKLRVNPIATCSLSQFPYDTLAPEYHLQLWKGTENYMECYAASYKHIKNHVSVV